MLVDRRCVRGSSDDKVGCDLGYRSHKTIRNNRNVKCAGSMDFTNNNYNLDCDSKKTENITCKFSTNLDFSIKGKKQLTNKKYKKKRMAYLNCVKKSSKKSKKPKKSKKSQN